MVSMQPLTHWEMSSLATPAAQTPEGSQEELCGTSRDPYRIFPFSVCISEEVVVRFLFLHLVQQDTKLSCA